MSTLETLFAIDDLGVIRTATTKTPPIPFLTAIMPVYFVGAILEWSTWVMAILVYQDLKGENVVVYDLLLVLIIVIGLMLIGQFILGLVCTCRKRPRWHHNLAWFIDCFMFIFQLFLLTTLVFLVVMMAEPGSFKEDESHLPAYCVVVLLTGSWYLVKAFFIMYVGVMPEEERAVFRLGYVVCCYPAQFTGTLYVLEYLWVVQMLLLLALCPVRQGHNVLQFFLIFYLVMAILPPLLAIIVCCIRNRNKKRLLEQEDDDGDEYL